MHVEKVDTEHAQQIADLARQAAAAIEPTHPELALTINTLISTIETLCDGVASQNRFIAELTKDLE